MYVAVRFLTEVITVVPLTFTPTLSFTQCPLTLLESINITVFPFASTGMVTSLFVPLTYPENNLWNSPDLL